MNYECDTPDEAKKAARKAIYAGADVLKMFATGGMATKGSIPNAPQLSEEQMRAGVRSIEHVPLDEETAKMMKAHGCYYYPTIVTRYNIIHSTEPEYEYMRKKANPQDLQIATFCGRRGHIRRTARNTPRTLTIMPRKALYMSST